MPRLSILQRIDPDENAVHSQELSPNLIGGLFVIDGGLGFDPGVRQFLEDAAEPTVLGRSLATRGAVAAPHDRDLTEPGTSKRAGRGGVSRHDAPFG